MLRRCISAEPLDFAAQHWGRKPLLSRSGSLPRDFDDLLSPAMVDELIAERGVRAPFIRMADSGRLVARDCYLGPAGFGAEMPDQIDSAKVLSQFASGATIVLQGLHRLWPPLIDFVRDMVDDLGHPVQANAYVTPRGNQGFDSHYDVHDVFVLQVAGQKRWVVHEPVHPHPLPSQPWTGHRAAIDERVTAEPALDAVLSPGDALYLPRGWVHSAQALDSTSIHLTIGVSTVTGVDVVGAIVEALASDAEFRQSLDMGIDLTDPDEMVSTASKVIAELVDTLRGRGGELSETAAQALARRHAERTRPAAVRPLATLTALDSATSTAVRWRHGLASTLDVADGKVSLRLNDRTIAFPEYCAPAVSALRSGSVVDAASLPGLDRADAAVLIRRLLREAVVVPVEAPGRG